jgi:hypothetical protein
MDQQCLSETRHADQDTVPTNEERKQDFLDYVLLTDDELSKLTQDLLPSIPHSFGECYVVGVI